jgi:hypothetical protein
MVPNVQAVPRAQTPVLSSHVYYPKEIFKTNPSVWDIIGNQSMWNQIHAIILCLIHPIQVVQGILV